MVSDEIISYDLFEKLFNKMVNEPEFEISFKDNINTYMLIKYDDYITFQRCGVNAASGEIRFNNLKELYETKTIDNICLKDDWNKITDIVLDEVFSLKDDKDELLESYNVSE